MKKTALPYLMLALVTVPACSQPASVTLDEVFRGLTAAHPQFAVDEKTLEAEKLKKAIVQTPEAWKSYIMPYNLRIGPAIQGTGRGFSRREGGRYQ